MKKFKSDEWGWMSADHLITSFNCLKEKDIDTTSQNPANIKVAVKNKWRKEDGLEAKYISIRSGPGDEFKEIGKVNIFEIRYAYKFQNNYVYIASEEQWMDKEEVMEGWVRQEFCTIWPSRIGVYYDKDNLELRQPVKINRRHADLLAGQSPIAVEDKNITEEQDYFAMRFPVIRKIRDTLNISFIGNAESPMGEIVSKQKIDYAREAVDAAINSQQTKEILFLIDATHSMQPYLQATYDVIKAYIKNNQEGRQGVFKYAFAIYRDYIDENGNFRVMCNLGNNSCLDALKKVRAYSTRGDNYTEAIFHGISKSVKQVNWGDGLKAIILIGDHGNHQPDNMNFTEEKVARELLSKDIWFYSINVNYREKLEYFNNLFRSQMEKVLTSNKDRGRNFSLNESGGRDIKEYKSSLLATFEDIDLFSKKSVEALSDAREGVPLENIRAKYGTVLTDYMLSLMRKKNISLRNMDLSHMAQVCEEGWAYEFQDGERQFKPWVLMTRQELHNFIGFLNGLLFEKDPNRVADSVRQSAQRALGDKIRNSERISEFLSRAILYIPYEDISPILQLTPDELQQKFAQDRDFRRQFCKEIGRKRMFLDLVLKEEDSQFEWSEEYQTYLIVGEPRKKKWFWTSKSGIYYAWIPFEYLP